MNIWERQKQIIEGIDEELNQLIETQKRIAAKKKKLEAARDTLAPEPWELSEEGNPFSKTNLEGDVSASNAQKPLRGDNHENSPRKFLTKEFRGMSVMDSCRQVVKSFGDRSFRERDISIVIFNYAPGMVEDRCHSACSSALIKLEQAGDCERLELGLYRKS